MRRAFLSAASNSARRAHLVSRLGLQVLQGQIRVRVESSNFHVPFPFHATIKGAAAFAIFRYVRPSKPQLKHCVEEITLAMFNIAHCWQFCVTTETSLGSLRECKSTVLHARGSRAVILYDPESAPANRIRLWVFGRKITSR